MNISRGVGWVVPAIPVPMLLAGNLLVDSWLGKGYWSGNPWPLATTVSVYGVLLWFLGRHYNKPLRAWDRVYVDSDLGFRVQPAPHSFYYVPVEWIGAIAMVTGVLFLLAWALGA